MHGQPAKIAPSLVLINLVLNLGNEFRIERSREREKEREKETKTANRKNIIFYDMIHERLLLWTRT